VNGTTKNFNAHVVIFSLAAVLALAAAIECHSINHLSGNILPGFHDEGTLKATRFQG
jgi:hypothetical protein